jgi:hypothetical protein
LKPRAVSGTRNPPPRPAIGWRAAVASAAVACLVLGAAAEAQVAPRQPRPARTVPQPQQPAASRPGLQAPRVIPAFPLDAAAGLCQCISDRTRRNISCLAGADACQSVCGNTHYSLVPNAAFTCPLAPGEQLTQ